MDPIENRVPDDKLGAAAELVPSAADGFPDPWWGSGKRMLYLVGGQGNADRVDVFDLFAERLAGAGLQVDWVIFSREPGPAWERRQWHGAHAYVVGVASRAGLAGAIVNKLREVRADLMTAWLILRGRYDVVQVRDKFVVGVLGLFAARLRGSRFCYWLSYPFAECRIVDAREGRARVPLFSLLGGKSAAWLLYRIIMPRADHVFVQSRQMLDDVAAEGIARERMTPVPMGVSERLLDLPPVEVEPQTILYLGTLTRVRKLDMLLHAMLHLRGRFPKARLIFVGEGDMPEDRAYLQRVSVELGLAAVVEFTGMLPFDQALARARAAAVCVSPFYPTPILLSTSPTKLIEYMALGRPVVASEHPEQSQIIRESGAGYCVHWDAQAYADAFAALFADPAAAEAMGVRGRDYVRSRRVYPVIAADLARVYQRVFG